MLNYHEPPDQGSARKNRNTVRTTISENASTNMYSRLAVPRATLQQKNRQPLYLLPKLSCFADWEHRPQEAPIARCVVTN